MLSGGEWWEAEIEKENLTHGYRCFFLRAEGSNRSLNAMGLRTFEALDSEDFLIPAWSVSPE